MEASDKILYAFISIFPSQDITGFDWQKYLKCTITCCH